MRSIRFPRTFRAAGTLCLAAGLFAAAALKAPAARGEWAIDAYLGFPLPQDEDTGGGQNADFDGNVTGGARAGYFVPIVKHFDVGAFIDISGVFQDIDGLDAVGTPPGGSPVVIDFGDIDFNFVPISPLVLLRVPFGYASDFQQGRYQLYGGAGPSLVWSELNGNGFDDQSLDLGADVRAGFNFLIFSSWGIFVEYRFTYFEPDFNDTSFTSRGEKFTFKTDVDSVTHYVMAGTGLRF